MSIVSIPNQPILFTETEQCIDCGNNDYAQLADFEDQIFFQVGLDCGGEQITNQTSNLSVWTYNGVTICNDGTSGGFFASTIQPDEVYYLFEVIVIVPVLNAGTLNVKFQGGQNYNITTAGEHTLYFNTDIMDTDPTPTITFSGNDFDGCFVAGTFQQAFVRGLWANHQFFLLDLNDNVVISEPDYIQAVRNSLTLGFDLNEHDLDAGCYRFGYSDECDNVCGQFRIDNGEFLTDTGWTLTNGASINDSTRVMNLDQTGIDSPTAVSDTALCEDKEYYVEISISKIDDGQIFAFIGNSASLGGFIQATTPGVHSATMTSTSGTSFELQLNANDSDTAVIDYVIVRYSDEQAPEITQRSNQIQIGDFSSCDYVKLEGCNADDNFNFVFNGSGFIPGIRVKRRFFRALYETETERSRRSNGDSIISFADIQKVKTLRLEQQPEYVYDFLSILVWFDAFYVNAARYVPRSDDFPAIEWNDANNLGNINLELQSATGKVRKVNCTGNDPSCLPTVFGDDEPFLLLENGDRMLTEDNDNLLLQE